MTLLYHLNIVIHKPIVSVPHILGQRREEISMAETRDAGQTKEVKLIQLLRQLEAFLSP